MTGAIFDMDGTLLDSMYIWDDIGIQYLRSMGVTPPDDLYRILKPMSLEQCCRYFQETLGIKVPAAQIAEGINRLAEAEYLYHAPLKPGVRETLDRLHAAGIPLCVATATARYQAEAALRRLGVLDRFSFILTCGELGSGKDRPEIFETALARLGTQKSGTVVFEDALHAIRTAKAAGFRVAAIADPSSREDEAEIRRISDWYFASFTDFNDCEVSDL